MTTSTAIPIVEVTIGERRREDYGDIEGLAESIKQYGLIHPIVVDREHRLVAGARRPLAVQLLGLDGD